MKKFTLLIFAALFAAMSFAQTTVQIGTGTGSNSSSAGAVLGGYYGYERHAVLYTAAELGALDFVSADISKIAFKLGTLTAPTASRSIKIYVKVIPDAQLTTAMFSNWATLVAGATLVYNQQGTSISLTANAWNTFAFSAPFAYTGGNLLIFTDTQANGPTGGSSTNVYYNTATSMHWQARADNTALTDGAGSPAVNADRADIQVTFDNIVYVPCPRPTALATSNVTARSVDINFTSAVTNYQYVIGASTVTDPSTLTPVSFTTKPYTINGLTPNTAYRVWVRNDCGGTDGYSAWTSYASFTTTISCPTPTSLTTSNVTASSVKITFNTTATNVDGYQYAVGTGSPMPADPSGLTWVDFTGGSPYVISTGLLPSTQYRVWVRIKCDYDANDYSSWTSYASFTTTATCLPPTGVGATNISTTAATINWTPSAYAETAWILEYKTAAQSWADSTAVAVSGSATKLLQGLTPGTIYNVRIKSDCGGGDKSVYTSVYSFTTIYAVPYIQNFETFPPTDWSRLSGAIGSQTSTTSGWLAATAGNGLAGPHPKVNMYQTNKYWLVTPAIDLGSAPARIQFKTAVTDYGTATAPGSADLADVDDQFIVLISTDAGATWSATNALKTWNNGGTPRLFDIPYTGQNVIIDLTGYSGVVKFAFYGGSTTATGDYDLHIGNVIVEAIPSCEPPTSVAASQITKNSAKITWTPGAAETEWVLHYKKVSQADTEYVPVSVTGTPEYTLNGLDAGTSYNVGVKSICSVGNESGFAPIIPLVVNTTPANDLCVDAIALPCGTTNMAGTTVGTTAKTITGNTASNYGVFYTFTGDGRETTITSTAGTGFDHSISIFTGSCTDLTFVTKQDGALSAGTETYTFTTVSGTTYYVYIAYYSTSGTATNTGTFTISRTCACPPPTAITVVPTSSSVTLSFTPSIAANYEYLVTPSSAVEADLAAMTPTAVATNPFTVNGLTPDTSYKIWIRSICAVGDVGRWIPTSFFTGYCVPANPSTRTYYLSSVTTTGGVGNNINYTNSTSNSAGYHNATAMVVSTYAGEQLSITLAQSSSTGYFFCWVDWNNDLVFNDAAPEKIFGTSSYTANYTGTITVPAGTPAGNYRMRVGCSYTGAITPCSGGSYGDYVDLTLQVLPTPDCSKPTITNIVPTTNSATVTFVENGSSTAWEYVVSANSTDNPDLLTPVSVTSNPFTIPSLTANTQYHVWLRSICSPTLNSEWREGTFYTGYCVPQTPSATTYYLASVTTTGGNNNITYTNSTANSAGYHNQTAMVVSNYIGNPTTINLTGSGGTNTYYFYCWIDWNNDLVFNDAAPEKIFGSTSYATNYTGTINIPAGTPVGSYRMRVASTYNAALIPCGAAGGSATTSDYVDLTFNVITPPSCPVPTITSIVPTSDNATVTLTENGMATAWQYLISTTSTMPDESTAVNVTTNPFTIPSLSANTQYYIWVRSSCSATDKSNWVNGSFRTLCGVTSLPWSENFDASTVIPYCWTYMGSTFSTSTTYSYSTPNSLRFYGMASAPVIAVTPSFNTDVNGKKLEFQLRKESDTYSGTFDVGYMTNINNVNSFVAVYSNILPTTPTTNAFVSYSYTLSGFPVGINHVAFRQVSGSNNWYYWIDDVSIKEVVNKDAAVTAITSPVSGANLTPTETVTATIKNFGTDPITSAGMELTVDGVVIATETYSGNITAEQSDNYTFTQKADLSAGGNHTISVRVILTGDAVTSNDMFTINVFNTICGDITTLPLTQDFEDNSYKCWTMISNNTANGPGGTTTMPMGVYNIGSYGNAFIFSSYSSASDYSQYLISPKLPLTTDQLVINLDAIIYNGVDEYEYFKIGYSTTTNDVAAFTWGNEISVYNDVYYSEPYEHFISYAPVGTKYVALWYTSDYLYHLAIDNIIINGNVATNTPPTVVTLAADPIGTTTATLHSTIEAGNKPILSSGYEYRVVGATTWATSADGVLSGLTPATPYEFRAFATTEDDTYYGEVLTFTTLTSGLPGVFAGNITLHPNPAKHTAILEIDGLNTAAKVVITDLAGREVATYNLGAAEKELNIDVSKFADGTYLVRIITEKGNSIQKLVVKK